MRNIDFYVGDVHGRADLLAKLLSFVRRQSAIRCAQPRITFVGDLIDRGKDSKGVVQIVYDTLSEFPGSQLIMGNHEDMFLDAIQMAGKSEKSGNWAINGGMETVQSYLGQSNQMKFAEFMKLMNNQFSHHLETLKNAKKYLRRNNLFITHAGVDFSIPLDEQPDNVLMWIRDKFLDFRSDEVVPVIHGHTPIGRRPIVTENRISIDTGACETGLLTACLVDEEEYDLSFVQASEHGACFVEPVRLDRGYGTLCDYPQKLFSASVAPVNQRGFAF